MAPGGAGARWRAELEGWAIPEEILAAAPESPWGFPVELWRVGADDLAADTPSRRRAVEALPPHGTLLDVGCGAGRAGLAVAAAARAGAREAPSVTGLDESDAMLAAFDAKATEVRVPHRSVVGSWPAAAEEAGTADVVVCHHVLYNVPDPVPFVAALDAAARVRVVLEVTDVHPLVAIGPLFTRFHGIERPRGPAAADLVEVLREAGVEPNVEHHELATGVMTHEHRVAFTRRRLCLPASRDAEVAAALGPPPETRGVVTLWWDLSSGPEGPSR